MTPHYAVFNTVTLWGSGFSALPVATRGILAVIKECFTQGGKKFLKFLCKF